MPYWRLPATRAFGPQRDLAGGEDIPTDHSIDHDVGGHDATFDDAGRTHRNRRLIRPIGAHATEHMTLDMPAPR